jgi:hypothetical protein
MISGGRFSPGVQAVADAAFYIFAGAAAVVAVSDAVGIRPGCTRVLLIAVGAAAGLLNIWLEGWGLAIAAAVAPILVAVVYYKPLWRGRQFWLVMCALTVLQIPLVVAAKPLADQLEFPFLFAFAILDFFLLALVINWVCPKDGQE